MTSHVINIGTHLILQSVPPVRNFSPVTRARLVTLCWAPPWPLCTQLCLLLLSILQTPTWPANRKLTQEKSN